MTAPASPPTALTVPDDGDDQAFANLMRERTKQRKEREDQALAHLRVQVRRLEAALAAETKRRVAAVAALQQEAQTAIAQVAEQYQTALAQEGQVANERYLKLEQRVEALEKRWESDVVQVESAIQTKATVWKAALDDVQAQAETERKARLQREGRLMQRIEQVAEDYQEKWKTERHDRVSEMTTLTERVRVQEEARENQVRGLESRIQEALKELDTALQQEIVERQAHDQELVTALNNYTATVQSSLTFVSGV